MSWCRSSTDVLWYVRPQRLTESECFRWFWLDIATNPSSGDFCLLADASVCFSAALSPGPCLLATGLQRIGSWARHGGQESWMFEKDWFCLSCWSRWSCCSCLSCWSYWLVALRSCQMTHKATHQTTQTSKSRIFHRVVKWMKSLDTEPCWVKTRQDLLRRLTSRCIKMIKIDMLYYAIIC